MKTTKIFDYYLFIGNKYMALKIKRAYFLQQQPHQKEIRRKRKLACKMAVHDRFWKSFI